MTTQLGEATIPIRAVLDKLDGDLAQARSKVENAMSGIGRVASGIGDSLKNVGIVALGALGIVTGTLTALGGVMAFDIKGAMDEQESFAKLEAVIEATGGAAGVTAEQARKLAEGMSLLTRYTHEDIEAGEAVLLRFKAIGEDTFPQATQTAVDLAASLGIDIPSAALMLGKALEAPGEGLLRLKAAGVVFTDEQQAMIDSMVLAGDTAGAQKFIMDALGKSVGGTAEKMGKTLGGQFTRFKNRMGEAAESIGNALLPSLQSLFDKVLQPGISIVENIAGAFGDLLTTGDLGAFLGDIQERLAGLVPQFVIDAIANVVGFIGLLINAVGKFLENIAMGMDPINSFAGLLDKLFGQDIANTFIEIASAVRGFIESVMGVVTPIWEAITQFVSWKDVLIGLAIAIGTVVIPIIWGILSPILSIIATAALLIGAIALLRNAWENDWGGIRTTLTNLWVNVLQPAFNQIWIWLSVNIPIAIQTLSDFWTNVLQPSLQTFWGWVQSTVFPIIQTLWNWLATNVPLAIQTLSDFWTGTLLPAITGAYDYFSTFILPIFQSVIDIVNRLGEIALTALAGFWEKTLQPALEKVYGYFNENILPIFTKVRDFIQDELGPKIQWLVDKVFTPLGETLEGGVKRALTWLHDQLVKIKDFLDKFTLPDWLTPGSPTPFEIGLRGIGDALENIAKKELPGLTAGFNLNASETSLQPATEQLNFYIQGAPDDEIGKRRLARYTVEEIRRRKS